MEGLLWRVRVSVLWIALAVLFVGAILLVFATPGNTLLQGEAEGGPITTEMLLFASLFWLVPLGMAVLTLALQDAAARWTNGIVGLVAAIMYVWDLAETAASSATFTPEMLMSVISVGVGLLIAWHAWKWPVEFPSMA